MKAVVVGEFAARRGGREGKNGVETFVPGVEPLVKNTGLEQRSREARKGESRIGFARHEPTTRKRDYGFGGDRSPTLHRVPGGLAERRAATNLLAYQVAGRDVLNVQRTKVIEPSLGEAGFSPENQQLGGAAGRYGEKV